MTDFLYSASILFDQFKNDNARGGRSGGRDTSAPDSGGNSPQRRSGYNPSQQRGRDGRWVETGAENRRENKPDAPKSSIATKDFQWERSPLAGDEYKQVTVKTKDLDDSWKQLRVEENGKEGIGDRYQNAKNFLEANDKVRMSEVTVQRNGEVVFNDGRHRFAALRDSGREEIDVLMRDSENFKKPIKTKETESKTKAQSASTSREISLPTGTQVKKQEASPDEPEGTEYTYSSKEGNKLTVKVYKDWRDDGDGEDNVVEFSINDSLDKTSKLSTKESSSMAIRVVKIVKYDASRRSDGETYKTNAYTGDSDDYAAVRAVAYEKSGLFTRPVGGEPGNDQYAKVKNGKLVADTDRLNRKEEEDGLEEYFTEKAWGFALESAELYKYKQND